MTNMVESAQNDFRHAVEFVMKTSPYTRADIMRLDCITFLKIMKECEAAQKSEVERLEKQAHGRHSAND